MRPVESAIRASLHPPADLRTPAQGARFTFQEMNTDGIVLLLGAKRAHTALDWECLEGIPDYLRGKGWMKIGTKFEVNGEAHTLDIYLKACIKRATAGWVAALLEAAGIVEISRNRPAELRLRSGF